MREIRFISNYENVRKEYPNCITISYRELTKRRMIILPKHPISLRLLVDTSKEEADDIKTIEYLNKIFRDYPNMELHINVEDEHYFENAKRIASLINANQKVIKLFPDMLLKDRTSLDLKNLNCITIIPLQYLMWHNEIENADSRFIRFDRRDCSDTDGRIKYSERMNKGFIGNFYNLRDALKLKRTLLQILNSTLKLKGIHPDFQKVLLVSQYLSKHIAFPNDINKKLGYHFANDTLKNGEGVCEGQAEAFMMLLNNPYMKIDCRLLGGSIIDDGIPYGHAWNLLQIRESESWFLYDQTYVGEEQDYQYAFFPLTQDYQTIEGAKGKYQITNKKIPNGFLKRELEEANKIEIEARRGKYNIVIRESLDETIARKY